MQWFLVAGDGACPVGGALTFATICAGESAMQWILLAVDGGRPGGALTICWNLQRNGFGL